MDKVLLQAIEEGRGDNIINEDILHGLGHIAIKDILKTADELIRSAADSSISGVKYKGIQKCTPEEQYAMITFPKNSKITVDIAPSTFFLSKIIFEYNGEEIPQYLWLPYSTGYIKIGGSIFFIKPVLSDKSLSPNKTSIFIRLLKIKANVNRITYSAVFNGKEVASEVLYSDILHSSQSSKKSHVTKALPTLMHYLLARYGFSEAFSRLTGIIPEYGLEVDLKRKYKDNPKWTVVTTRGVMPKKTYVGKVYVPIKTAFAIPTDKLTDVVRNALVSMFYILDHLTWHEIDEFENPSMWQFQLGYIYLGNESAGTIKQIISNHFTTINSYVDNYFVNMLYKEFQDTLGEDFSKDGFFKILMVIFRRFDKWVVAAEAISASAFDKRLEVNYNIMYAIIESITRSFKALDAQASTYMSPKIIKDIFRRKKFTVGKIFGIRSRNISCESITYPGDHKFFKIGSTCELQINTKGVERISKKGPHTPNPTSLLHSSHLVVGTVFSTSKTHLSPLNCLNLFAPYDKETNTIIPDDGLLDDLKNLDEALAKTSRLGGTNINNLPKEFNIQLRKRR